MRRLLGALALAATLVLTGALAGCGGADDAGDEPPVAQDPAPTDPTTDPTSDPTTDPTTDPTSEPGGTDPTRSPPLTPGGLPFELVGIVSATAAGGRTTGDAVEIGSEADLDTFVAGFSDELAQAVRTAYDDRPDDLAGRSVYAAVVGLGCDVPPGVDVGQRPGGYRVTGLKVADPLPNCFAPVTSVALVAIG